MERNLEATLSLAAVCAVTAFLLTAVFRGFALRKGILDVPVARSSHIRPVPRGGGSAVVVATLVAVTLLTALGLVPATIAWGLIVAAAAVALIGFVDDLVGSKPITRLGVHVFAAAWLLYWIGVPSEGFHVLGNVNAIWSLLSYVVVLLYLVWNINLYNFMDGIDGLASTQMIFVCTAMSLALACTVCNPSDRAFLDLVTISLAGASTGFLLWNFPKARVFLGDVGSGFMGLMVGGLSLAAAHQSPALFWCWLILMGLFFVDATYTLIRRVLAGASPLAAHRTHGYQILARQIGTHWQATLLLLAINVFWLLPWAYAVAGGWIDGPNALAISYLPLVVVAQILGAGTRGN